MAVRLSPQNPQTDAVVVRIRKATRVALAIGAFLAFAASPYRLTPTGRGQPPERCSIPDDAQARFVRRQPTVLRFDESLRNVQLDGGQQNPSGAELAIWQCLWAATFPEYGPLLPVNVAFVFTKRA
jgi:hypothetical protein